MPQRTRRAAAAIALLAGVLSGGMVAPPGSQVGAAPRDVNLICEGASNDSAALFPLTANGGFDSQFLVGLLIGQIGQPGPDEPQVYPGPQLGFAATAQLDHDLPDTMLTTDVPAVVHVSGSVQLSSGFLESLRNLGFVIPFEVAASNHVGIDGRGVIGDHADQTAATITQDPAAPPVSIPVDLTVTATPSPSGGPVELDYNVGLAMALDQQSSSPGVLDFATMSMNCETAGEPQSLPFPDEYNLEGDGSRVAVPQPLADGFVARPGGVIARTDRLFTNEPMAHLDVLSNDEALGVGRSIDPTSLTVTGTEELVDVAVDGDQLMFTAGPIPYSEFPYGDYEGAEGIDRDRFPILAGLTYGPFVRGTATYRICDDGDPASCADGQTEVIMPLSIGDPCEDPNLQIDCGPWEPEVDTTCSDDMSICEVPGCTWSDDAGRYVCTYPGMMQSDPSGPLSTDDTPPSRPEEGPDGRGQAPEGRAPGKSPDGRGPGDANAPPPGVPLTPAFTG